MMCHEQEGQAWNLFFEKLFAQVITLKGKKEKHIAGSSVSHGFELYKT